MDACSSRNLAGKSIMPIGKTTLSQHPFIALVKQLSFLIAVINNPAALKFG